MSSELELQPRLAEPTAPRARGRRRMPSTRAPRRHGKPAMLVLRPSPDCVVGFLRVPNLKAALRQARAQGLVVAYVHRAPDGEPLHAGILWRGKPVIVTDGYDGTEIH